jgi:hypothetical protein
MLFWLFFLFLHRWSFVVLCRFRWIFLPFGGLLSVGWYISLSWVEKVA